MNSIILISKKNDLLIFLSILITGLWFPKLGIPFIVILSVSLIGKRLLAIAKLPITEYFILLLFIFFYILLWDDPSIPIDASYFKSKKAFMFLELLIIISCIFWIILFINQQNKLLKIMQFFVFGMFIKSLFITFYTYLYYPELLLKRVLFDPFSMQECNSPAISLMAVYGFLFSIYSSTLLILF